MKRYFVLRFVFNKDHIKKDMYCNKMFFKRKRNIYRGSFVYPIIDKFTKFGKFSSTDHQSCQMHNKEYDYYRISFGDDINFQILIYNGDVNISKFYVRTI